MVVETQELPENNCDGNSCDVALVKSGGNIVAENDSDGCSDEARLERSGSDRACDGIAFLTELSQMDPDGAIDDESQSEHAATLSKKILICADDAADDEATRRKLVDKGVVSQILAVLLRHPKSEPTIEAALGLLAVVLQQRPDLHSQIAEVKGPQLIIRSMINTRSCKALQASGCSLLLELTATQQNREIMGQFFAIEVVVSALKAFGDDIALVTTSCAFLANIGFQCPDNKQLIVENGGLKALLRVMKKKKEEEAVMQWCVLALRNLTLECPANQETLISGGVIRILLGSILLFKDNGNLVDHGLALLFYLISGNEEYHTESSKQTLELRGVEIIVRCMRTFRNVTSLQLNAVGCLRALADNGDSYSELVLSGGGLEAVLSTMIANRAVEELQANGIRLIYLLGGLGKSAKQRIVHAGGLNTISVSLKTHIGNEKLVESGVATLSMLRAVTRSI